jgi:tRNA threonylcarbamoyladenosine biosynthesis protein TsaE
LGSGKTCLVKGISIGCDCQQTQDVTSPTFVLVNQYQGRLDIYHIDAYRLEGPNDLVMLGFQELLGPDSVVIIEWADKLLSLLQDCPHVKIQLEHLGPQSRKIVIHQPPWDLDLSKV